MKMETESQARRSFGRRFLVAGALSGLAFLVLWTWSCSLLTAALIAAAPAIVIVAGSSASDAIAQVVDVMASALLFALDIVVAIISAIFDMFD